MKKHGDGRLYNRPYNGFEKFPCRVNSNFTHFFLILSFVNWSKIPQLFPVLVSFHGINAISVAAMEEMLEIHEHKYKQNKVTKKLQRIIMPIYNHSKKVTQFADTQRCQQGESLSTLYCVTRLVTFQRRPCCRAFIYIRSPPHRLLVIASQFSKSINCNQLYSI